MRIILFVLLSVLLLIPRSCLASDAMFPGTVDLDKAGKIWLWNSELKSGFWPSEQQVKANKYTGDLTPETERLKSLIGRVVRQHFAPSDDVLRRGMIGLAGLRDGADYLVLQYRTTSGYRVQLQEDGTSVFLLVTVPDSARQPLSKVGAFVWATALQLLEFPEVEGISAGAQAIVVDGVDSEKWKSAHNSRAGCTAMVTVPPCDLGNSKLGVLEYGAKEPKDRDWYSNISWWADGQLVLYRLATKEKADYEREATTAVAGKRVTPGLDTKDAADHPSSATISGVPSDSPLPRVFRSRERNPVTKQ